MQSPKPFELPPAALLISAWPWTAASDALADEMQESSDWPRISIVTPSFNQGEFIERTIRSVLLQGYPNLEYMIIDGGSNDQSVEIIRKYGPWLSYWVSEDDNGQSHAINKGLSRANGDIMYWLNADDYLAPGALGLIAKSSIQYPDAVAWVGICHRIDAEGNLINSVIPRELDRERIANWWHEGFFYQPACFFSSKAWQAVGPLNENLNFALDLDLWLRLLTQGDFVSVEEVVSYATVHGEAKTQQGRIGMHLETLGIQIRYGYLSAVPKRLRSLQRELCKVVAQKLKNLLVNRIL